MWPASALLTGNGVAFVLRVPGHRARRLVEHEGLVDLRRHGGRRAPLEAPDPLPRPPLPQPVELRPRPLLRAARRRRAPTRSPSGGGRCRRGWCSRSRSSSSAPSRSSRGCTCSRSRSRSGSRSPPASRVIAASGHEMTARWHLGPITGFEFWRVLVLLARGADLPLLHDHRPEDDRRREPVGRRVYAVSVGAPRGAADRAADDGVLDEGRAARRAHARLRRRARSSRLLVAAPAGRRSPLRGGPCSAPLALAGCVGLRRACSCSRASRRGPSAARRRARRRRGPALPPVTVLPSKGVATQIDPKLARQIAADLVADLRIEADALRSRDKTRAAEAAGGTRLQGLWQQIGARGQPRDHRPGAPRRRACSSTSRPPSARRRRSSIATVTGTERLVTVEGTPPTVAFRGNETPFTRTLELQLDRGPLRHRRLARRHARGGRARDVGAARLVRPRGHPARGRRRAGRDRLPAERVPDSAHDGHDRDDGRRRLLGRHRQRRLARPLRGQLVRRSPTSATGSSTAARPAARSSAT